MDHVEGTLATFRHTAPAPRKTLSLHRTTGAEPYLLRVDGTEAMRLTGAAEAIGAIFQQLLGAVHAEIEEHTSELQSLMRISYAVFCLKKKMTPSRIANVTLRRRAQITSSVN